MSFIALPPELRSIIYRFCFPLEQTPVQIFPYRTSLPACRLNLPLSLYCVCKLIHNELVPLPEQLRRLDFTYIVQGTALGRASRPEYPSRKNDDPHHFERIMRFAERVRLVGAGPRLSGGRSISSGSHFLEPGPKCALKILEIQPRTWGRWYLAQIMLGQIGPLTTHPDVAERLEVRLIRDADDPLEDIEEVKARLRRYQEDRENRQGDKGPIYVNVANLDRPAPEVDSQALDEIEAWLEKFQNLKGKAIQQRAQPRGPLK
ncbi:hypothetical protein C8R44DRAFT_186576 [Mycena epipterygia]|nr:hypothetical protein C8R44DRAFT_186576 [Mycena epipterygia]